MSFDFILIGNTPKATLLACMLAKTHKKQVALIANPPNKLRLLQGFDISIAPITRPKTWKILKDNISATLNFLNKTSAIKIYEHIDPLFFATNIKGESALSHIHNMANAYGFNTEKQARCDEYISAYRFSDVIKILRRPFFTSLNERLKICNVRLITSKTIKITHTKDQSQISFDKEKISTKQIILVDDEALVEHLSPLHIKNNFIKLQKSVFLSEPISKLKNSFTYNLDTGIIIHQKSNKAIDCLGGHSENFLEQEIKEFLSKNKTIRLAGKTSFTSLATLDNAPIFGEISNSKYISICNFNMSWTFQTPAIARMLTNEASKFEKEYFLALAPKNKKNNRKNIAEYSPVKMLNGEIK